MSQWIHVVAAIRYNYLHGINENAIEPGCFGYMRGYTEDDTREIEDNVCVSSPSIPTGSDGSLSYRIVNEGGLASRNVLFYGDLRDYDDVDEILKYFASVTDSKKYSVRNAVLEIEVEGASSRHYYFDTDDHKWIMLGGVSMEKHREHVDLLIVDKTSDGDTKPSDAMDKIRELFIQHVKDMPFDDLRWIVDVNGIISNDPTKCWFEINAVIMNSREHERLLAVEALYEKMKKAVADVIVGEVVK